MKTRSIVSAVLITSLSAAAAFADGGLTGKVVYHGHVPKPQPIAMNADAQCDAQHTGGFKFSPLVVDASGGVDLVFVHVIKGLEGKKFPTPADSKKVTLTQKGCWYEPHVFGIQTGQKLEILNDDPVMHNVNGQPDFNAAMPPGVPPMTKSFSKPKIMFPLKCNIHPWMHAFVGVVDNPYYAVTGANGKFDIKDLPAGKYTIEAWNEKLGAITKDVTVPGNITLEFPAK
jgi:hypothetical protein